MYNRNDTARPRKPPTPPPPSSSEVADQFGRFTPEEQFEVLFQNRKAVAAHLRALLPHDDFRLDDWEPCKEFVGPVLAPVLDDWARRNRDKALAVFAKTLGSKEDPHREERRAEARRLRAAGLSWGGAAEKMVQDGHTDWFRSRRNKGVRSRPVQAPLSKEARKALGKALQQDEARARRELPL
jgi:hypothetical protein